MAKRLVLFSLRLLFINAVMVLLALVCLNLLFSDQPAVQWVVTLFMTILFWVFLWLDAGGVGKNHVQNDKIIHRRMESDGYMPQGDEGQLFQRWFGFAAGLLAQSPIILLTLVDFFVPKQVAQVLSFLLLAWNLPYSQFVTVLHGAVPYIFLLFPVLFAVVAGLGYQNAPVQQARMETIIERNKTRQARLVREDKEREKKQRNRAKK